MQDRQILDFKFRFKEIQSCAIWLKFILITIRFLVKLKLIAVKLDKKFEKCLKILILVEKDEF